MMSKVVGSASLKNLHKDVRALASPSRALFLQRFFKTGKGEYAEGDVLLGLTVPQSRKITKKYSQALSFKDIEILLKSPYHEERLIALLVLVNQFSKGDKKLREKIARFYLRFSKQANNWDLVDSSAPYILGPYLFDKDRDVLYDFAKSKNLWQRRIAMMSTFYFIMQGESRETLKLAKVLLRDEEDLIHKAVGWMLREVGKRVREEDLLKFLDQHAPKMPRTMLRYSLERLSPEKRKKYMQK